MPAAPKRAHRVLARNVLLDVAASVPLKSSGPVDEPERISSHVSDVAVTRSDTTPRAVAVVFAGRVLPDVVVPSTADDDRVRAGAVGRGWVVVLAVFACCVVIAIVAGADPVDSGVATPRV